MFGENLVSTGEGSCFEGGLSISVDGSTSISRVMFAPWIKSREPDVGEARRETLISEDPKTK